MGPRVGVRPPQLILAVAHPERGDAAPTKAAVRPNAPATKGQPLAVAPPRLSGRAERAEEVAVQRTGRTPDVVVIGPPLGRPAVPTAAEPS